MNIATWSEFANRRFPYLDQRLQGLPRSVKSMQSAVPPFVPADTLGGVSILLAEAVAALGVRGVEPQLEPFLPLATKAFRTVNPELPGAHMTVQSALWFGNLAETMGRAFDGSSGPGPQSWLPVLASHAEEMQPLDRQFLAYPALAFAQDELLPVFLGPIPSDFAPGRVFQFDYPLLIAYLSAACRRGAAYQQVEPAWLDFLRAFPYKLSADTVNFPDLFYVGRAVYHRIGGLPVSEVARETHKQIMQLVAQGY